MQRYMKMFESFGVKDLCLMHGYTQVLWPFSIETDRCLVLLIFLCKGMNSSSSSSDTCACSLCLVTAVFGSNTNVKSALPWHTARLHRLLCTLCCARCAVHAVLCTL